MISIYDVVKKPLVTEKGAKLKEQFNTYVFQVDPCADKPLIKRSIEQLFGVKVKKVRTTLVPGKFKRFGSAHGRTARWKKAVVQLKEGQIQLFEVV